MEIGRRRQEVLKVVKVLVVTVAGLYIIGPWYLSIRTGATRIIAAVAVAPVVGIVPLETELQQQ